MKAIIKREIKNYLKNPLLWLGMVFIAVQLLQILGPYLELHYFASDAEVQALPELGAAEERSVLDGYVMCSDEERLALAEAMMRELTEAEEVSGTADTSDEWLFDYCWDECEMRKGSMQELNAHIDAKMQEHSYSWYFGRKFADFCGLFLCFFAAVLLAFLFLRDSQKDTYELLHTKPVKPAAYMAGKIIGGFLVMLFVWGGFTALFGTMCEIHGRSAGLPVRMADFLIPAVVYVLPNLLMVVCVYALVALIFKNPLPGVPLLFLYIVYSNLGGQNADGVYGYYGRPLAIMVRFPGDFLDVAPPPLAALNQSFLLLASVLIFVVCVQIWKRRRVY